VTVSKSGFWTDVPDTVQVHDGDQDINPEHWSPTMQSALIVDAVVLAAVLQADLGENRRIDKFRLMRPVLVAAGIVPVFLEAVTTHGKGLDLEVALTVAGIILGRVAVSLMTISRSPATNKPVSGAGAAYGALWIVVIGARAAFTYGSSNWFSSELGGWMVRNGVTSKAIVDGLIFMAVAMVLTRTLAMARRARHIPSIDSQDAARHLVAA
jgi:hypothetical protein